MIVWEVPVGNIDCSTGPVMSRNDVLSGMWEEKVG